LGIDQKGMDGWGGSAVQWAGWRLVDRLPACLPAMQCNHFCRLSALPFAPAAHED